MISGFLGVSLNPKTNIIYLWRHQDISNNQEKARNIFKICENNNLKRFGEDGWKNHEGLSSQFLKIMNIGINIPLKT